ncbi:MAG: DUF4964 domain-containing protein, partial [Planctomycetaceae bacterium]|nr:DUF4964 domain-containing protein [Planctomycetaceae bacterium]
MKNRIHNPLFGSLAFAAFLLSGQFLTAVAQDLAPRPPAVPLVAVDPYFSIWSQSDQLWNGDTTHWTGRTHRLAAIVRVDGTGYRLMGSSPQTLAA